MTPEPMDLILCSGNARISKRIIWFNKLMGVPEPARQISHIAEMTWNNYVLESTTLNKWCNKQGVQINNWQDWLSHYDGRVWVRGYPGNPQPYEEKAWEFVLNTLSTPYENGIPGYCELIKAGMGLGKLEPTTNIHCSENVTRLRKLLDQVPQEVLNYILSPAQYWIGGGFDRLSSVMWGKPERVK